MAMCLYVSKIKHNLVNELILKEFYMEKRGETKELYLESLEEAHELEMKVYPNEVAS
jgi:hypothetical protein